MTDEIICTLENNDDINVSIEDREEVGTSVDNTLVVVDPDHTKLTNRGVPDQHPISAITGLESALSSKADKSTTYTKTETDNLLDTKADKSTTYTKTEVNAFLSDKADKATTYTKTETDTLLNTKQDVIDSSNKLSASLVDGLSNVATSGDYNDLTNKPSIPTKTSDLTNDSGYITKDVNDLTNYTKTSDLGNLATKDTVDYDTDITNRPQINGVTLSGDKSSTELKIGIDEFVGYIVDSTAKLPTMMLTSLTALVLRQYSGTGATGFYKYVNGAWESDFDKNVAVFKGMTIANSVGTVAICTNVNPNNFSIITDPNKQDKLVSGENIKTINNESILGSGNIEITTDVVVRSETMPLSATTLIWIDTSVASLITADDKNFITTDNKNFILRS